MKQIVIDPIHIGKYPLDVVFEKVFGKKMLKKIHGESVESSDWDINNKRIIKFCVEFDEIPSELKDLLGNNKVNITSKQTRYIERNRVNVNNRITMNIMFSELFSIEPEFYIEATRDGVYFSGRIQHNAVLPPPLNRIAESFMMERSQKEIEMYKKALLKLHSKN